MRKTLIFCNCAQDETKGVRHQLLSRHLSTFSPPLSATSAWNRKSFLTVWREIRLNVSCCRSIRMTQIISICSQPEWREDHLSWLFSKSEVLQASVFAFNPFIHPVTWKHGTLSTVANRCDANMMPPPPISQLGWSNFFLPGRVAMSWKDWTHSLQHLQPAPSPDLLLLFLGWYAHFRLLIRVIGEREWLRHFRVSGNYAQGWARLAQIHNSLPDILAEFPTMLHKKAVSFRHALKNIHRCVFNGCKWCQ